MKEGHQTIEIHVPTPAYGKLRTLREATGYESDEAMIVAALSVFGQLVGQAQQGSQIGWAKDMQFSELKHPAFENAIKNK